MAFARHALLPILAAIVLISSPAFAQQTELVQGTVVDAESSKPIAGATVRVANSDCGTYASNTGAFRIPLPTGTYTLIVSSIGYRQTQMTVTTGSPSVVVKLEPSTVQGKGLEITADLDADQIISRAIDRKDANVRKLKTFQGLLYSKFGIEIDGNAFGQLKDENRMIILETFSRNYFDAEKGPRIVIIQRRQTANIPSDQNLFAFGNFFSFYDDELPLLNVKMPSPLNRSALGRYRFTLRERTTLNDSTVYVIGVEPTTTVLPAWRGTIKIIKGSYDLIEVDLRPSASTAIQFVKDLRFVQKFERFNGDVWQPTYLQVTGKGSVEIIKGFAEIGATFTATSIFTEAIVNQPLPDTVFNTQQIFSVDSSADSTRPEFWEKNSLSELSDREREIYHQVDSLVAAADTSHPESSTSFSWGPWLEFNRVGSVSLGATVSPRIGPVRIGLLGGFSFGLQRAVGTATASMYLVDEDDWNLSVQGDLFSQLEPLSTDRSIPRLFNTAVAALLHRDYYDWMRRDGWSAGINAGYGRLRGGVTVENSRQFAEPVHTSRTIFRSSPLRENPPAMGGSFRLAEAQVTWGNPDAILIISSGGSADIRGRISARYGEHVEPLVAFRSIEGFVAATVPTIPTGYLPMKLQLGVGAGFESASTPIQYQFRMPTSVGFVGRFGQFLSAPVALYGGTEYVALHAEHDFSDLWWRWLGLPLYEGRGIDLIASGAAGRFRQSATFGYRPTDIWYTEAGFGLGRIPTFLSNVIFLRLDARWGIGPLGSRQFGAIIGISSPF